MMRNSGQVRTTVNLEADVVAAVEEIRRTKHVGLSEAVNELARAGMRNPPRARRFRQRTYPMDARIDVTDVGDVLDILDTN